MSGKPRGPLKPSMDIALEERVWRIAEDHIWYSARNRAQLEEIARSLAISPESALALAIADQVCEEFQLIPK